MGKLGNSICIVIIIILVIFLASGTTYLIMSNHEEKEVNKDNEIENNESKQEEILLSEEELNEYLSYIPESTKSTGNNDICGDNQNVYCKSKTNVNSLDKKVLVGKALAIFMSNKEEGYPITTFDELAEKVLKIYNVKIDNDFKSTYDADGNFVGYAATYGGIGFNYNENIETFDYNFISSSYSRASYIDSYKATNDELIIYSYYGVYNDLGGNSTVYNIYNGNEYTVEDKNSDGYLDNTVVANYIKNNKDKFTLYKHTFKKNNTGYYWYQTEVVEN